MIRRVVQIVTCVMIITFLLPIGAIAGEKGDKSEPLKLESSKPAQGEENIQVDSPIELIFSKNVVNMKVKDANTKCFSLLDEDGKDVPIEVKMADDQMEREKRETVILVPKTKLNEGKAYTVVINKDLKSKSGASLAEDVKISFTTAGGTKSQFSSNSYLLIGVVAGAAAVIIYRKKRK